MKIILIILLFITAFVGCNNKFEKSTTISKYAISDRIDYLWDMVWSSGNGKGFSSTHLDSFDGYESTIIFHPPFYTNERITISSLNLSDDFSTWKPYTARQGISTSDTDGRKVLGIYKNGSPQGPQPVLIIMAGESNSTGNADNGFASSPELAIRSLQLLNNSTYVFGGLQVAVNNIINAAGGVANCPSCVTHGMELGLANQYENGDFGGRTVYLVKAGQGGSLISEWDNTDAYYDSLINRITRAINLIEDATGLVPKIFLWWSQGINDMIATTNSSTWKAATETFFSNFRTDVNTIVGQNIVVPIFLTRFDSMSGNLAYETVIGEIDSEISDCEAISTIGASLKDPNHWQYDGFKDVIVPLFVLATLNYL